MANLGFELMDYLKEIETKKMTAGVEHKREVSPPEKGTNHHRT